MDSKTCIKCGGTWPISFFYVHRKGKKRARCIGCDPRNNPEAYLLIRKARNSIARHAKNRSLSKIDFCDRFAWNPLRMAEDLAHASSGNCPYCRAPNNGWQSLTFDVIDPTKPPHYSANVRIRCFKRNNSKRNMPPEAWAERVDTWVKYREWIEKVKNNPIENLPLFQMM